MNFLNNILTTDCPSKLFFFIIFFKFDILVYTCLLFGANNRQSPFLILDFACVSNYEDLHVCYLHVIGVIQHILLHCPTDIMTSVCHIVGHTDLAGREQQFVCNVNKGSDSQQRPHDNNLCRPRTKKSCILFLLLYKNYIPLIIYYYVC